MLVYNIYIVHTVTVYDCVLAEHCMLSHKNVPKQFPDVINARIKETVWEKDART